MKICKILLWVCVGTAIIGCSDPKNTVVPTNIESWKSNQTFKKSIEKLPDEDKKLLAAYAMRGGLSQAFGGEGIKENTTIGQAIESQKLWESEKEKEKTRQRLLAEELKQKQLSKLKEMNQALTVTLMNLEYHDSNFRQKIYDDYFSIQIGFKNNTGETISGAKGTIVLKDMFGTLIKQITLPCDDNIPAGAPVTFSGTFDSNQFNKEDQKLKNTEFSKLTFEWHPEVYLFENGKKLVMPQ